MTSTTSRLQQITSWRLDGRSWLLGVIAVVTFGGIAEALIAVPAKIVLIVTVRLVIGALAAFLFVFVSLRRREQAGAQRTRLAAIVEGSNDAIIGQTLDGVVTDWNPAAERMFGYAAAEAIGHTALSLIVPAELQLEEADLFARVGRGEATPPWQTRRRRRDGALLDVSITVSPLRSADGRIMGVAKTVRDISASKAAEAALLEAQARLRLTTQASGVGFWEWDRSTGAFSMDDTMLALHGRTRRDYDGLYETWTSWLDPSDVAVAERLLSKAIADRTSLDVVFRTRTPQGELRHIRAKSAIDFDAADQPIRLLGVSIDITAQKAREAEVEALNASLEQQVAERTAKLHTLMAEAKEGQIRLEALNRDLEIRTEEAEAATIAKSQFLANMSHEIRSPMNAILGMLQLLSSTDLSPRQKDYAHKAYSATRSLLYLLNDILDFSKIEADKLTLENTVFSIDAMMRDITTSLAGAVGNKPLELVYDVAARLPPLMRGDVHRLRQILLNLISNAIKFTERGEVVVSIEALASERQWHDVTFSVRDTGIGIASENLSAIFDGFTQAEASTTRRYGGSGLGLAICRRLVALMGGELRIDSELGVGSRFYFTLRLEADAAAPDLHPRGTATSMRVLIIDDHPIARASLLAMAESIGWRGEGAASVPEALERLAGLQDTDPFGAILLDAQIPGWPPWETADRLRALSPKARTPIIFMGSAGGREALIAGAPSDAGAVGPFLIKPVTASMLNDAIMDISRARTSADAAFCATPRRRRLAGLRLLVVEDHEMNQQVACELLSREGALVDLAESGAAGVDKTLTAHPPYDAVLMDIQMPAMDGYQAARRIRAAAPYSAPPIIAMTANAMAADKAACMAAGMQDHIAKPIDLDLLVDAILARCGRPSDHALCPAQPSAETGVAFDLALARLGGDTVLFRRVLTSLTRQADMTIETIRASLATGATAEAARLLHMLKGDAGAVGLTFLAEFAASLEREVETSGALAEMEANLQSLEAKLRAGLTVVRSRLDSLAPETPPPEPVATRAPEVDAAIDEVDDWLAEASTRARRLRETLRRLTGGSPAGRLAPLVRAMDRLDFDRAREDLSAVRVSAP